MPNLQEIIDEVNRNEFYPEVINPPTEMDLSYLNHCYVCHGQYTDGISHTSCEGSRFSPCGFNCTGEQTANNPYNPIIDNENFFGRSIMETMYPIQRNYVRDEFGSMITREVVKKVPPKTLEQRCEETIDKILEILGEQAETINVDITKTKLASIIIPFVDENEECTIKEILKQSDDLRTCHDIRCFINDYMFRNK